LARVASGTSGIVFGSGRSGSGVTRRVAGGRDRLFWMNCEGNPRVQQYLRTPETIQSL
jgi:hypothetical protein